MLKKLLILMTLTALLAACLPSQQPTADVQAEVNTAVAGTMQVNEQIDRAVEKTVAAQEAGNTNEAPVKSDSNVLLQASATPKPTKTPIPTSTATPTKVPPTYSCSVTTNKPTTNQPMNGGQDFDIKWTIKNTGNAAWYDALDLKYYSGESMATSKRAEIKKLLQPGESYVMVLDAKAPKSKGPHFMAWMVEGGMCYAYVTVWVK